MTTYPNQKVIYIQKDKCEKDFLQISIDEWQEAARELSDSAFKLYLYLGANNNGFKIALSQKAVQDAIGLSKSSYHRAVDELIERGYLISDKHNNEYVFMTNPI